MVGGAVRDMLLGRRPHDLDLATAAPPEVVRTMFERTLHVGEAFGVTAVIADGHPYQVATFRSEGPYLDGRRPSSVGRADLASDALRRDFTVNALFYDPVGGIVHDLVGGCADLERRQIRAVGDPAARFAEDHLRLLRAVRLASELQFRIEEATLAALRSLAREIDSVSVERVREELERLLVAPGREEAVVLLADCGLLSSILPEVAALRTSESEGEDLLTHSSKVLGCLRRPDLPLAVASVLHHVEGRGGAEAVCRRLRLPSRQRRAIVALLREFDELGGSGGVPGPLVTRRVAEGGSARPLLELCRAHALATGEGLRGYRRTARNVAALTTRLKGRLLSGHDLIELGHRPGPRLGRILAAVEEAQSRGDIGSADDARRWVAARFPAGSPVRAVEPACDTSDNKGDIAPGGLNV